MDKINALALVGGNDNGHDWKRVSSFLKGYLEGTGKFRVTVSVTPAATLEDRFLRPYSLFIVDWGGPDWGPAAQGYLESAISNGSGLLLLHGTQCVFKGWAEMEKMAGLMWREGTSHMDFGEFKVSIQDHEHPITRGIPDFVTWDELWYSLVNVHKVSVKVLATAYSDPEVKTKFGKIGTPGSGKQEPVVVINEYGRGRVFNMILGHIWGKDRNQAWLSYESEHFRTIMLRACEWAATGQVEWFK